MDKYLRFNCSSTSTYELSTTKVITYVVNLKLGHNGDVQHNLKASQKVKKNMHIVCFLYTTESSLGNNYVVVSTSTTAKYNKCARYDAEFTALSSIN